MPQIQTLPALRLCARSAACAAALSLLAAVPARAEDAAQDIALPSGHSARWLDTVTDVPGPAGPTYRYRFVMPDLAALVPATAGPASEDLTDEDMAELDGLGTAPPAVATSAGDQPMMDMAPPDNAAGIDPGALAESELVAPEDLNLPDFRPEDFTEGAEAAADQPGAVPPDPDLLLQDPVHGDITWLCENWVLARLPASGELPAQVIISLSDRPTTFGQADQSAVQLFEAFAIAPDRKSCVWEGF